MFLLPTGRSQRPEFRSPQQTLAAARSARSMAPPPPPPALPEEVVEQILLRFPPDEPACLAHAALVCKPWCALVSGAGFRRRFSEFHRAPPLLGFFSNVRNQDGRFAVDFVPTCSLPASQAHSRRGNMRVLDAHHGRVLLYRVSPDYGPHFCNFSHFLVVWDPTTDLQEELSVPDLTQRYKIWTAAVLCAAGGPCDHLDCRQSPFLIVFVAYNLTNFETVLCTYSSTTASWSKPIYSNQFPHVHCTFAHIAHVESAIYFGARMRYHILKFDLESQEFSWIQMPTTCSGEQPYVLTNTEGGGLGLATIHESSKLYMWSRASKDGVSTWTQSRVIELETLLPVHAVLASPRVLGFTVGTGVVIVMSNNVLFVIDLKTYKVIKEVSMRSEVYNIVPYMSFYTPVALRGVSTGGGL